MKKCRKLWNKQRKSTLCADTIKEILGVYLKTPTAVRWNSERDSVQDIINKETLKPGGIKTCCDELGIDAPRSTALP